MPLSQEFKTWLGNPDNPKIMLAVVKYYDTEERTEYLSSHPYIGNVGGQDIPFKNRIIGAPSFSIEVSAVDGRRTSVSIGELTINNADGKFDEWMSYGVDGRTLELYIGPPKGNFSTEFGKVLIARVDRLTYPSDTLISIVFKNKLDDLDKPIQDETYIVGQDITYTCTRNVTHTNNPFTITDSPISTPTPVTVTTPIELEDVPLPLTYGYVRNITPVLISSANAAYQVHGGPINKVVMVYDQGVPVHFHYDPATGIFELQNNPAGAVTCDVEGAKLTSYSSQYSDYLSDILVDIIITKGGLLSSEVEDNRISGLLSTGVYISDRRNILEVLDELLTSIDGYYGFNIEGKFYYGVLAVPSNIVAQKLSGNSVTRYGDIFYEDFDTTLYTDHEDIPKYIIASDQIANNVAKSTAVKTAAYFLLSRIPNNTIYRITDADTTGTLDIIALSNVAFKNTVKYAKNYTVQTDLAAGSLDAQREFAQLEWRQRKFLAPTVQTKFVSAIDAPEVLTTFTDKETINIDTMQLSGIRPADILLTRLATRSSEVLYEVSFSCLLGTIIEGGIGAIVQLRDRRFGFKEGRLIAVTSLRIDYLSGVCEVKGIFYAKPFSGISDKYLLDKAYYSLSGTNTLTYISGSDPGSVNDGVIITSSGGGTVLFDAAQYSYVRYFEFTPRIATGTTLTLDLAVVKATNGTVIEPTANVPRITVARSGSTATIRYGTSSTFLTLTKTVSDWNNYTIGVIYDFNSHRLNVVTPDNGTASVSAPFTELSNYVSKSILITIPSSSSVVLSSQNFKNNILNAGLLPWAYIAAPANGAPIFFPAYLLLQDEAGNFLETEDNQILQLES